MSWHGLSGAEDTPRSVGLDDITGGPASDDSLFTACALPPPLALLESR